MKRFIYVLIALLVLMMCVPPAISATAPEPIQLKAKSAILVDAGTGRVLFEKNPHDKLPPASITKIMTLTLIMEALDSGKIKWTDTVVASAHAEEMGGSEIWLEQGEKMSVEDLVKAIAIFSANDASVAMAEYIAGSHEGFVERMNKKAQELGMKDTQFANCTGLPTEKPHYTSAYDIALMSRELLKHPKIHEYLTIWDTYLRGGKSWLVNTNKLLNFYEGADGIKTGYTDEALYCLAATAKRKELRLISVVLGCPDSNVRFTEAAKLLDYGFANYSAVSVAKKGEIIQALRVDKGKVTKINVAAGEDINVLVDKGNEESVQKEIILPDSVKAPVTAEQKVGEIVVRQNGTELGRFPLVAVEDVAAANLLQIIGRVFTNWLRLGK